MCSRPFSHSLTFWLPKDAWPIDKRGTAAPGCRVDIDGGAVSIVAPSREAAFDQAAQILRVACKGMKAPITIACTLHTLPFKIRDGRDWLRLPGPSDPWTIIVGADVAFSPTGLDPHIPAPSEL